MDRKKRPARLLGLVCLLPLTVTGCRTIVPTKPAATPNAPNVQEGAGMSSAPKQDMGSIVKTEFRSKATTDQQFNIHLELGKQQMRDGQFESALGEFKKALEACNRTSGLRTGSHRTDQQALAQRKIASALDWLGKFKESEEHYKQAAKLTPNDPRVWNDLGYSYYMQSRWADSERCLRRAAKLDPDSPLVQTNLGLAVAAEGRRADALELLSHSSGKAVGHANLGFALATQGREVEARDEYRKALELQPQLTIASQALARLDNPQGRVPGARTAHSGVIPHTSAADVPPSMVAIPGPTSSVPPSMVSEVKPTPVPSLQPSPASDENVPPVIPVNLERPTVYAVPPTDIAPLPSPSTPQRPPSIPQTDLEVRPTSMSRANAPPVQVPAASRTSSIPIPMPIPAPIQIVPPREDSKPSTSPPMSGAPRPIASRRAMLQASAIPMPIPAPKKPASSSTPTSIPMPVPVERQLAPPVSQRTLNATSRPAIEANIRPVPSSSY